MTSLASPVERFLTHFPFLSQLLISWILPAHIWIYGKQLCIRLTSPLAHTCNTSQTPLVNLSSQNNNFTLPFSCQKIFCNSLKMKSDIFHLALPISSSHVTLSLSLSCLCSVCLNLKHLFMFPHPCLENPMDGGAWWAAVHGVAKSQVRLSDFPFTFHFHALEKEMATHSSVLAWRIPGTGEPGGLPSMGSHSRTRLKRLSSSSTMQNALSHLLQQTKISFFISPTRLGAKLLTSLLGSKGKADSRKADRTQVPILPLTFIH